MIGAPVLRREDARFLTGRGSYVADLRIDGVYHCAFVRSPHAHARITSIDVASALALPGVLAVYTGADLASDGVGPMRALWNIPGVDGSRMIEPARPSLARDVVRHVGEAIAVVVAVRPEQAQDAAEALAVTWQPLPAVVDVAAAVAPGAPLVHGEAPGNQSLRFVRGSVASVDQVFAQAAHCIEIDLVNQRLVCAAMEPRAVVALPAPDQGASGHQLTLYSTTQVPHHIRKLVAEQLNLPETSLRVIAPDVGGGFGTKGKHYPEETVLAWAALRLRVPLRWVSTRSEAFLTDYQARDHRTHAELALDAHGRFLALRVRTLAALGAWVSTVGAAVPTSVYSGLLSGPYQIAQIDVDVRTVFTHSVPTDAYRGAGRPEACYVLERLVEKAARECGFDRIDLRRRNFILPAQMPYSTAVGPTYDSGDFPRLFDRVLELIDYAGFAGRRVDSQARGRLRGFGVCYFVESSGVAPSRYAGVFGARVGFFESADIRVAADGSLVVSCGTHNHGQGHATSFAQVVADRIGVPIDQIEIVEGDTGRVPFGTGTFGSRSMAVGGSAIARASDKILAKARLLAAHLMEAADSDVCHEVEAGCGYFRVNGTDRRITFLEVARAAANAHNLPAGMEPALHEQAFYDPVNLTWSNGAQACEIEVDPDTGVVSIERYAAVDDIGTVVNPLIVEGQVHGALAQGIGQALWEGTCHDQDNGQLYTASFMDYVMPRADGLPSFATEADESQPCTHNPLGVKGCGESGTIGAPAALASALLDALAERGITDLTMPFGAQSIWRALHPANP